GLIGQARNTKGPEPPPASGSIHRRASAASIAATTERLTTSQPITIQPTFIAGTLYHISAICNLAAGYAPDTSSRLVTAATSRSASPTGSSCGWPSSTASKRYVHGAAGI